MEKTYNICGTNYTEDDLVTIIREQLPTLRKYSHFSDAEIELGYVNKEGALFFLVSNDDGEDMLVKIGPEDKIYWDWTGRVLD
jgi:hypothetical protein